VIIIFYFRKLRPKLIYRIGSRTAFKEDILENLDWMDDKTKKRARAKMEKMDQGPILQNSISAENFSDKFSFPKF
jgi:hypothetical protein